jgi:hypothetical protein
MRAPSTPSTARAIAALALPAPTTQTLSSAPSGYRRRPTTSASLFTSKRRRTAASGSAASSAARNTATAFFLRVIR